MPHPKQKTHLKASEKFCGIPIEISDGYCKAKLKTTDEMAVDEKGLVHGGFTFSLADFCAMCAVNHPNVVLAKAEVKFLKPVKVGDELEAVGKITEDNGRKKSVQVDVFVGNQKVFEGKFICVITEKHVLENSK